MARCRYAGGSVAERIGPALAAVLEGFGTVSDITCQSQIGSGALPTRRIPSAGLAITPHKNSGTALNTLAAALRALPIPVIGRIQEDAFILDLRCLEDEDRFIVQLPGLDVPR